MRAYIETFGCTFNKGDSEIMAGILSKKGIRVVDTIKDADLIIINTCYVKHPTEHKVINRIKKVQELYPSKPLIVTGCMEEIDPEKLEKIAPRASWIGPHKIHKIYEAAKGTIVGERIKETGPYPIKKAEMPRIRFNPHIHIIQLCEGCLGECRYCCTRFARGKLQSHAIEALKREAEQAIIEGCKELQLTAQDTAAYGRDIGENLPELLNQISSIEDDFRIRVGMMHPMNVLDILEDLIDAFKSEKIYKFLHLPVQSGNNRVLEDMGRGYTVEDFRYIVESFREEIPEMSIATDIIVGYPTEDEKAFQDTCKLLKEIKPNFIHLSKYKHRPRAPSSSLKELDFKVVKRRSKIIEKIKSEITIKDNMKLIGKSQKILIVEKGRKGGFIGRTNSYIPVITEKADPGSFLKVKINGATNTYLTATPIE